MSSQSYRGSYISNLKIHTPAIYQIEVQGEVDILWSDNLAGMNITSSREGENVITTLIGKLNDQAALAGLLQTIYDMKLPIISVEYKG